MLPRLLPSQPQPTSHFSGMEVVMFHGGRACGPCPLGPSAWAAGARARTPPAISHEPASSSRSPVPSVMPSHLLPDHPLPIPHSPSAMKPHPHVDHPSPQSCRRIYFQITPTHTRLVPRGRGEALWPAHAWAPLPSGCPSGGRPGRCTSGPPVHGPFPLEVTLTGTPPFPYGHGNHGTMFISQSAPIRLISPGWKW